MARNVRQRNERPVIYIICEGKKTEPSYFTCIKDKYIKSNPVLHIKSSDGTSAINIVNFAIQRFFEQLEKDNPKRQIWCVFDADNNSDAQLQEAMKLAKEHNIQIAFSNPCFEFWYLLHFEYSSAQFIADQISEKLEKLLTSQKANSKSKSKNPQYDKAKCPFDILWPKREDAMKNAEKLYNYHGLSTSKNSVWQANPITTVSDLVKSIIEIAESSSS